ncbi:T9SS type A sorting domain-containing protein [Chryseobacterium sp.]|uniref:T9SS type A sorting domain-containing protein n=1 Tax=Chryseobacterium sp. TaxID=1871047 RepID=UPI0025BA1507|nr:T9SS type A sorting domain-containing protein [Chryseobacterium sp.]MBV8324935.1 T9SS type A sorting domain-containing protein [Chryseobacterium sp.]
MIRIYILTISFILSCLIPLNAQSPCSDFNDATNPAGNWTPSPYPNGNVSVGFGAPNVFDGSQYLILKDRSGGSWYENSVDFRSLGKKFMGQCIYFDFYLENDSGYGAPFHPYITLSDGTNSTSFVANVAVTPGSGWVRVKAPIQLSSGGLLPSNSEGSWTMTTVNTAVFDNIIMNTTTISITPDLTSTQQEVMYFDNICVKPCESCTADFTLDTSFSTSTNAVSVKLTLTNPILISTPGNPGPTYTIDWGDGTSSPYIYPTVPHNYPNAGSYTVCVTERQGKLIKCTKCFTFCYKAPTTPTGTVSNTRSPFTEVQMIAKKELQTGEQKDFSLVPNPAKSYVDVQTDFSKKELVTVRIIDTFGKVLLEKSENLESGRQIIKLSTERLLQGTYVVELKSNDKTSSQKLLISK